MNTFGKLAKGFSFGTVATGIASILVSSLQSAGCNVQSTSDLKILGLSILAGIFAGVMHAAWHVFYNSNVGPTA